MCDFVAVKKIVGVTTRSASGALHTKFRSSSSDSDSSTSSSSSCCSSEIADSAKGKIPPRKQTQWDVGKRVESLPNGRRNKAAKKKKNRINTNNSQEKGHFKETNTPKVETKVNGKRKFNPEFVFGGPNDILTTRSVIYNPSHGSIHDSTVSKPLGQGRLGTANTKAKTKNSTNNAALEPPSQDGVDRSISTTTGGGQINCVDVEMTHDSAPDYSTYPDIHGPPRSGDKMAFKVL